MVVGVRLAKLLSAAFAKLDLNKLKRDVIRKSRNKADDLRVAQEAKDDADQADYASDAAKPLDATQEELRDFKRAQVASNDNADEDSKPKDKNN